MKGRIKAGEGTLVGNAGEHYVMAELLKRGVIAALTPRNATAFDILATKNGKDVRLRVKTKSEDYDIWQWNAHKDGSIFRLLDKGRDFTILVNLAAEIQKLHFYVVPTKMLSSWLTSEHELWLKTPGKDGRKHSDKNKKRHLDDKKHSTLIAPYLNNWDSLWN
ncbi:hypothetical protein EXS70_00490 [Candidatus Peribacteria bacterium]|nr:hypothetical protein [Candidatus Peribacteria bacterium]